MFFFFFYQEEWIFINTHAERRWDIWRGNEATSGWEASIRGFQGKLATKKKIVPTQNWDVAGLPDLW